MLGAALRRTAYGRHQLLAATWGPLSSSGGTLFDGDHRPSGAESRRDVARHRPSSSLGLRARVCLPSSSSSSSVFGRACGTRFAHPASVLHLFAFYRLVASRRVAPRAHARTFLVEDLFRAEETELRLATNPDRPMIARSNKKKICPISIARAPPPSSLIENPSGEPCLVCLKIVMRARQSSAGDGRTSTGTTEARAGGAGGVLRRRRTF